MIVGTAGHIDHGKTALVGALTGVDTDRLKEEKARGISIDLGFAYLRSGAGTLGFIDVPGHERLIHTMLAGAGGIDLALLAVAADDGVMPQTREHVALLDLLGISCGIVALTKADLAGAEQRARVAEQISALLADSALMMSPVLPVSVVTGEGIEALRERLVDEAGRFAARSAEGRFRLAVDRSFTLSGAGTVVTGTVLSGRVAVGDKVSVSPAGLAARVRSIHAQNAPAPVGRAGQRCALNLVGEAIGAEAVRRGDMVLAPALHAPTERIDATLRVLAGEPKPLGSWFPVRLHHGASEVGARLVPLSGEAIAPGGAGAVQLVLERPLAAAAGDRYVLRDTSAQRTIGGGRFLDLRAPARRRRTPQRLEQLAALALETPAAMLEALLRIDPWHLDLAAFARDHALGAAAADELVRALELAALPDGPALIVFAPARWAAFRAAILATLEDYHAANPDLPGLGLEKLRFVLTPRLPKGAFARVMQGLAQEGAVALDGAWARLAGHEVRLTGADERLWEAVEPRLGGAERFRPPRVRDIAGQIGAGEADLRRLMKLLGRLGKVGEVAHDHFFLRESLAALAGAVRDVGADGPFSAGAFRDRIESAGGTVGRKVAIQILEFFDRHGVTLRRGDLRRVNPHRLDLFGAITDTETAPALPRVASDGREASLVGRPDFKSGRGREPVLGGFDSHSLPPVPRPPASRARPG